MERTAHRFGLNLMPNADRKLKDSKGPLLKTRKWMSRATRSGWYSRVIHILCVLFALRATIGVLFLKRMHAWSYWCDIFALLDEDGLIAEMESNLLGWYCVLTHWHFYYRLPSTIGYWPDLIRDDIAELQDISQGKMNGKASKKMKEKRRNTTEEDTNTGATTIADLVVDHLKVGVRIVNALAYIYFITLFVTQIELEFIDHFPIDNYFTWIPSFFLTPIWGYVCFGSVGILMMYFVLISSLISVRFRTLNARVRAVIRDKRSFYAHPSERLKFLDRIEMEHIRLCRIVRKQNRIWSAYLLIIMITLVPSFAIGLYELILGTFIHHSATFFQATALLLFGVFFFALGTVGAEVFQQAYNTGSWIQQYWDQRPIPGMRAAIRFRSFITHLNSAHYGFHAGQLCKVDYQMLNVIASWVISVFLLIAVKIKHDDVLLHL